jgi:hypothetical protein
MSFTNTDLYGGAISVDLPSTFADTRSVPNSLRLESLRTAAQSTSQLTSTTAKFGKYRTTRKSTLTKMATHPSSSKFLNTKRKAATKKRCNTILPTSSMRKIARTSWRRAVP